MNYQFIDYILWINTEHIPDPEEGIFCLNAGQ